MILRDASILAAMARAENSLTIDPPFKRKRLQPASLELTLAPDVLMETAVFRRDKYGHRYKTVEWKPATLCLEQCPPDHHIYLQPGDFWLASTVETVRMPTDLAAMVNGKSSLGRKGLVIHQTAGFIDPGFKGQVTLELSNVSHKPIRLTTWMPICQLVFMQMDGPADRPYGSDGLGSHYMGQRGPTPSRS
jgi:dCTP deaminase